MSQKLKNKRPNQSAGAPKTPSALNPDAATAEVRKLIDSGKHKAALDAAKDLHKAAGTPETEALLIDAYLSRISALLKQNLTVEAKSLIALVGERYPAARRRLEDLEAVALARAGNVDELLRPLNDPGPQPERRAAIERAITTEIADPRVIANSNVLPPEHPVRRAAEAVAKAFTAVTKGPAGEELLALPEVSHRSPFAPWKMLVRAIAALYAGQDDACRKALEAIPSASAPSRLITAIGAILAGDTNVFQGSKAGDLVQSVLGTSPLAAALEDLDEAFAEDDEEFTLEVIGDAAGQVRKHAPELYEEFKQRVVIRCMMDGFEPGEVAPLLGGPIREDPEFMRLLASGMEQIGHPASVALACGSWNEFRRMAVKEGRFEADGPESAMLYLHMAGLLAKLDPEDLAGLQHSTPDAIRARPDPDFRLDPEELYERGCLVDPRPEAFSEWLKWASQGRKGKTAAVRVATAWHAALPGDIEPVIILMDDAAKRNKYPMALKYLAEAERIDPLTPRVRRARLRFMAADAMRLLRLKNTRQTGQAIDALAALPQAQQGDRPAFIAALRFVFHALRGDRAAGATHRSETVRHLGSEAGANLLIWSIALFLGRGGLETLREIREMTPAELADLPKTMARVLTLAADVGLPARPSVDWIDATARQFESQRESLSVDDLQTLGEVAGVKRGFAYDISSEGLRRGGPAAASFLLLRARALTNEQPGRSSVCASAAAELGRQHRDNDVIEQAIVELDTPFGSSAIQLDSAQAFEILKKEQAAPKFPTAQDQGPDYSAMLPDQDFCNCAACRRKRRSGGSPWDDEDLDEDLYEESANIGPLDAVGVLEGMPPPLFEAFLKAATRAIERGLTPDEFCAEMGVDPGELKPRKKGRRK